VLDPFPTGEAMTKLIKKDPPKLISLDDAKKLLAAAKKPEDVKAIRDQAQALQTYARQRKESLATLNLYGEIKLRGERRLGEIVRVLPKAAPGRKRKQLSLEPTPNSKGKLAALKDQGISKVRAREWERLAGIPQDSFEYYIDTSRAEEREITTAGALRMAGGKVGKGRGGAAELLLGPRYVDAVHEALGGGIDLDPASSERANRDIQATKIFTEEDDGLAHPWPGRVYLFPPRDADVSTWIDYLLAQHREKTCTEAVLLVDAATERAWFQSLWRYPICFTDHKVEFLTANGKTKQLVTGSAFVYLGAHVQRFQTAFREIGTTVTEMRS
jgi:hypothetical protein